MLVVYGDIIVKIYVIYRGPYGEQIINNLAKKGFANKIVNVYELKPETIEEEYPSETNLWAKVWENPDKYVPKSLPLEKCDLLLVLGLHPKLGDLVPPIAKKLDAKAVLYPICDRDMDPEAKKTVQDELEAKGIHVEFPEPFCTLEKSENEFINEFAKNFGRPKFGIKLDENKKTMKEVKVIRDSPGGTATCTSQKLVNFSYEDKEALMKKIYDEHHNEGAENYCLAEMDPLYPLMQEASDLLKDAICEACGFTTTKEAILKKIGEFSEIGIKELKEIIVGKPGDWKTQEKSCEADRTFYLYIDELIGEGKIIRTSDNKLKLT
ncbi:hypothetical protein ES706_02711 [subsurface metagenome]